MYSDVDTLQELNVLVLVVRYKVTGCLECQCPRINQKIIAGWIIFEKFEKIIIFFLIHRQIFKEPFVEI
jgi:hypothetical protein